MKKVLLLLADGFEIYEASVFIDVIGWNLAEGDHSTELFTCGLKRKLKVRLISVLLLITWLMKLIVIHLMPLLFLADLKNTVITAMPMMISFLL